MNAITIIDHGCSNILNLVRAINFLGHETKVTRQEKVIMNSTHVILPGVGAFSNAMLQLKKYNLDNIIIEYAKLNKPMLGICLGMQILLTSSEEFGTHKGLGIIAGKVNKISNKKNKNIKIPHVGWNEIYPTKNKEWNSKILNKKLIGKNFYFVHSFVASTKNTDATIASCEYSEISIPAVIEQKNIFGCQFHPEKSGENGLNVLQNFCSI